MRGIIKPALYFVADPDCCAGRDVVDVVMAAVQGGVTAVQLRNKTNPKTIVAVQAAMLAELLKPLGVTFIVNDYPDIARDADADGVHIGQGDLNPQEARRIIGSDKILGLTAFAPQQIEAIDPAIVDYIGTGPVYPTKTDKGKPVLGVEKFAELVKLSPVPVIGIGGITPENYMPVMQAGASGVAMMRSISEASDIEGAARAFKMIHTHSRAA